MANVLATHTRVTLIHQGQKAKGSVLADSTENQAHIEVLGVVGRPKVFLAWDRVCKIEYRCFAVTETGEQTVITEVEPKNSHPLNWMGSSEMSRESAWAYASARGVQTVFVDREGYRHNLGEVFSPKAFENAAYQGYVSYGHSMTDGYYAPIQFDAWVKSFRQHPEHHITHQNDMSKVVKAALPKYLEALASLSA